MYKYVFIPCVAELKKSVTPWLPSGAAETLWAAGAPFRVLGSGSNVLIADAGVREVGVIGQPSPKWGESVCAVIVRGDDWKGDDELLVQELRTLVQSRLARFKQPKTYVFMNALPRNPSGKILKRMLREQFPGPAPE